MFVALRQDPWCMPHVLELAIPSAVQLTARKPDKALELYCSLGQPFAVYLYEEQRMTAAHAIAGVLGPQAMKETLQAYEPNIPWNGKFLESRYRVYRAMNHPLADQARRDWVRLRDR